MACSRSVLDSPFGEKVSDEIREIFEICKNGDVSKVRRYIMNGLDLNIRDTAGRKSSPLHFAAGEYYEWKYRILSLLLPFSCVFSAFIFINIVVNIC
jgi:hypothetical protein